jgi:hypothetical protein
MKFEVKPTKIKLDLSKLIIFYDFKKFVVTKISMIDKLFFVVNSPFILEFLATTTYFYKKIETIMFQLICFHG